jgi:hypothetical protein
MSYRARWDAMANPKSVKEYQAPDEAVAVGDLMWYDRRGLTGVAGGVARPFSSTSAWTGSADGTRARVAEAFLGVAMSAHDPNNPGRTEGNGIRIAGAGVFGYPCDTPYTFDIGDLIVPVKDPSGNKLYAQVVAKGALGADPQDFAGLSREVAIGKAHRRYAAVSGVVEFQINGIHESGAGPRQFLTS